MRRLAIPLLLSLPATPALAEITSVYTDLDIGKCRLIAQSDGEGDWAEWDCPGLAGHPVRVSEDDLRFTVSFGGDAEHQCAAQQTFNRFNSPGPRIEWRLSGGRPFATILRWYQDADGVRSNWLVVSKYDGAEACHVAYVDPAMPEANALARRKADRLAPGFRCDADRPEIVSQRSIRLEEIAAGWPCPVE
jgi:hypothetical protein